MDGADTAEVLVIRVLDPTGHDGFIRQPIGMLKIQQARHQPRRCGWTPRAGGQETSPFPLEELSIDQRGQCRQLMPHIDHVGQPGAQEIILLFSPRMRLHHSGRTH